LPERGYIKRTSLLDEGQWDSAPKGGHRGQKKPGPRAEERWGVLAKQGGKPLKGKKKKKRSKQTKRGDDEKREGRRGPLKSYRGARQQWAEKKRDLARGQGVGTYRALAGLCP